MREGTFKKLIQEAKHGDFGYTPGYYSLILKSRAKATQAVDMIAHLLRQGVPLSDINTNDWQSSLHINVYVRGIKYRRFTAKDHRRALADYAARTAVSYRRRKQRVPM